ncbi:uncharacterized protein [Dermacentor andersoni]|uniref:uncharacterized protein isoform X2 n=1 Tax=Dermacentor andersoni TaxID=34620 RepID=UPI0024174B96|nr:uncharacterized protein LOC126538414 isoform X2 [Dermacentor andersoni]
MVQRRPSQRMEDANKRLPTSSKIVAISQTPHVEQRRHSQIMEDANARRPSSSEIFTISNRLELPSQELTQSLPKCLATAGRLSLVGCDPIAFKPSGAQAAKESDAAGIDRCWWVAGLAFFMTTMESSSSRCSGFLMVGIMEHMNVERGLASWPVSLIGSLIDCGGLLSGPLSELFTTVPVLVGGSVLAAAGVIASSFAPDITWLSVTLGAMHGFFRDGLGSYNEMFWVLGSFSFFVSVQWALVSLIDRKRARRWKPDIAHKGSGQKS